MLMSTLLSVFIGKLRKWVICNMLLFTVFCKIWVGVNFNFFRLNLQRRTSFTQVSQYYESLSCSSARLNFENWVVYWVYVPPVSAFWADLGMWAIHPDTNIRFLLKQVEQKPMGKFWLEEYVYVWIFSLLQLQVTFMITLNQGLSAGDTCTSRDT